MSFNTACRASKPTQRDLNLGGEQCHSKMGSRGWGGHVVPSNWAHRNLISSLALPPPSLPHPVTLRETLLPHPHLNNSHSVCSPCALPWNAHSVWVGWEGTSAKCRDRSQHGSWWEIERYNGVTNPHSCESFGPLTPVASAITSLPPPKNLNSAKCSFTLPWSCMLRLLFLVTIMRRV